MEGGCTVAASVVLSEGEHQSAALPWVCPSLGTQPGEPGQAPASGPELCLLSGTAAPSTPSLLPHPTHGSRKMQFESSHFQLLRAVF